jgi:hypothetical protein
LSRNPLNRTTGDLKTHEFFQDFNWDKLVSKEMASPYKPKLNSSAGEIARARQLRKNLQEFISRDENSDKSTFHRTFKPPTPTWDEEF